MEQRSFDMFVYREGYLPVLEFFARHSNMNAIYSTNPELIGRTVGSLIITGVVHPDMARHLVFAPETDSRIAMRDYFKEKVEVI